MALVCWLDPFVGTIKEHGELGMKMVCFLERERDRREVAPIEMLLSERIDICVSVVAFA